MALIRGVENGVPISTKLAGRIEAALGVDARWILGEGAESPIPAGDGTSLTTEGIRQRVKNQIVENKAVVAKAAKRANLEHLPNHEMEAAMLSQLISRYYLKCAKLGLDSEFMSNAMEVVREAKRRIAEAQARDSASLDNIDEETSS
jgi:predicted small metal-binding protein